MTSEGNCFLYINKQKKKKKSNSGCLQAGFLCEAGTEVHKIDFIKLVRQEILFLHISVLLNFW